MCRNKGFTFVELLVALAIFAIMTGFAYRGLTAMLESREALQKESRKWRDVALFVGRIERDLSAVLRAAARDRAVGHAARIGFLGDRIVGLARRSCDHAFGQPAAGEHARRAATRGLPTARDNGGAPGLGRRGRGAARGAQRRRGPRAGERARIPLPRPARRMALDVGAAWRRRGGDARGDRGDAAARERREDRAPRRPAEER